MPSGLLPVGSPRTKGRDVVRTNILIRSIIDIILTGA
jgi:hypothetical protein